MRKTANRESMIALKAAHQAVRIARDLSHPHLDVEHVFCDECHQELDWQRLTGAAYLIFCPNCGKAMELPCHLRGFVSTPREEFVPVHYEYDNQLHYSTLPAAADKRPLTAFGPITLPVRIFFYFCLAIVIVLLLIATRK